MPCDGSRTDKELIKGYLAGDAASFPVLYDRYRRPLYAYLSRLLQGGKTDPDDVFQQTWLRAIGKLDEYRDREKFQAWLTRIAYNLAMDSFRKEKRRAEEPFDNSLDSVLPAADRFRPDREQQTRELARAIRKAEEELSPELRAVFRMRRNGIPFREIAEIQRCSINTCLARMRYALGHLRRQLASWHPALNCGDGEKR